MRPDDNVAALAEFPQLGVMLDEERAPGVLERTLDPHQRLRVARCRVTQLHYKPGSSCSVVMLAGLAPPGGTADDQIYHGTLFAASDKAARHASEAGSSNLIAPRVGPPFVWVPEWSVLLWAFPNDPRLHGLPAMVDAAGIVASARARPRDFGLSPSDPPPTRVTAEQVRYVPRKRCGYVYRFTLPPRGSDGAAAHSVYGRLYSGTRGRPVYEVMRRLWETPARAGGAFGMPEPYAYHPETGVLWQQFLAGERVGKAAAHLSRLPEMCEEIGARLAAFHGCGAELPPGMGLDQQREELHSRIEVIAATFPEHAGTVRDLGDRLVARGAGLGVAPPVPAHGELRVSHAFSTQGGIAFIDFDEAGMGDAAHDLGRVLSDLWVMEVAGTVRPAVAAAAREKFQNAYDRAASIPVSPERVPWFTASHLVANEAHKMVKHRDRGHLAGLLAAARSTSQA